MVQNRSHDEDNRTSSGSSKGPKQKQVALANEFGGPWGTFFIIIYSHFIVLYLFYCNNFNQGRIYVPTSWNDALYLFPTLFRAAASHGDLTFAVKIYSTFAVMQGVMYMVMPGIEVIGRKLPQRNNLRLVYNCNGVSSFYLTHAISAALHFTGVFRLSNIVDNLGALVVVSMIAGDAMSLFVYVGAHVFREQERMTGNVVYDFFMGAWLNPRFGRLDLKMLLETRVAWIMLFYITLSCAIKQHELTGSVNPAMYVLLLAHFLYANACMKGEECVCTTWDIFHEKLGWMLIFWNMCGVPLAYSFQPVFVLKNGASIHHSTAYLTTLFVVLIVAYYIWDTANSQKNRFKMMLEGSYKPRPWAQPQLPWGTLDLHGKKKVSYIKTEHGHLLTDGWYRYGRKIHYTADIVMALVWGLACGLTHFLPFYYVSFFTLMIVDRANRDAARCARKYGKDWDEYCRRVPYIFVPGIY